LRRAATLVLTLAATAASAQTAALDGAPASALPAPLATPLSTPLTTPKAASYTAFVGNDQCPTNNSVSQLTGPTWTLGATVGVGNCPAGIAFSPDGTTAYVLGAGDSTITPIDTASFTAGAPFASVVVNPIFIATTPDGQSILTAGASSNNLAVISTQNTASAKLVGVGAGPEGIAVLPDSSAAYVANQTDGTVSVVKLGKNPALKKTITFPAPGCTPFGMAATPDGKTVLAACTSGSLWPINVAKNTVAASPFAIPQSNGGAEVVVTPNGKTAYVSNTNGFVYPVTLKGGAVGAPIAVPGAWGLAISPDGKVLMVGDGDCCFINTPVSIVNTAKNTVTTTLQTPGLYTHRWLAFQP
jgi:DNA-binding beta-propeller fold protein YncE